MRRCTEPEVGLVWRRGRTGASPLLEAVLEPVQGELAVARLTARVLGHGGHPRPRRSDQAPALVGVESAAAGQIEAGLDPRGG